MSEITNFSEDLLAYHCTVHAHPERNPGGVRSCPCPSERVSEWRVSECMHQGARFSDAAGGPVCALNGGHVSPR